MKPVAQIDFDDLRVVLDPLHRSFRQHLALVEHGDPVGDVLDELHVVLDDEHRARPLTIGILSNLSSMGEETEEGETFLQTVTFGHLVEELVAPQRARDGTH